LEVYFAEGEPPVHCESLAELEATLDLLHRDCEPRHPILVCIDLPRQRLDIGLGADPTFVIINTQPCDGEYWISVGDEVTSGYADFYGCGHHQQLARRHLIPLESARSAIRTFVQSGVRSPEVCWEDWAGRAA
jgi:hypothetical protein